MGEEGGNQAGWWLGGEEAQKGLKLPGGEQAMEVMGLLLLCRLSEVRSLENMARASGKLGGVAGVLLGVHICGGEKRVGVRSVTDVFGVPTCLQELDPSLGFLTASHTRDPSTPRDARSLGLAVSGVFGTAVQPPSIWVAPPKGVGAARGGSPAHSGPSWVLEALE